jgi:hypothetical protein
MSYEQSKSYASTKRSDFQFAKPVPVLPPVDRDLAISYILRNKIEEFKEYVYHYPEVIDMKDVKNGNAAVHLAASKGNIPLIQFLLQRGANMNIQDYFGNSSLHYAVDKSRKDTILFLLNSGARINIQDFKGNSPLHIACVHDDFEIAKILLMRNADPELTDLKNGKPFDKTNLLSIKNLIESRIQLNHKGGESIDGSQTVGWMTFGVGLGVGLGMAMAKRQQMLEEEKRGGNKKKKNVSMAIGDDHGGFTSSTSQGSGGQMNSPLRNAGAMVVHHDQSRQGNSQGGSRKFL